MSPQARCRLLGSRLRRLCQGWTPLGLRAICCIIAEARSSVYAPSETSRSNMPPPVASSITMYASPDRFSASGFTHTTSSSCTTFGCVPHRRSALTSCSTIARGMSSSDIFLTATWRPVATSMASHTSPNPPLPRRFLNSYREISSARGTSLSSDTHEDDEDDEPCLGSSGGRDLYQPIPMTAAPAPTRPVAIRRLLLPVAAAAVHMGRRRASCRPAARGPRATALPSIPMDRMLRAPPATSWRRRQQQAPLLASGARANFQMCGHAVASVHDKLILPTRQSTRLLYY